MRRNWLLIGAAAVLVGLLAAAWIDGGEEPLRLISEPVNLPGADSGAAQ
jgi:hypothetical protein